jgi:sugar lactone lactonase YvrE
MLKHLRVAVVAGVATVVWIVGGGDPVRAQGPAMMPVNDAPNPFRTIENHFKLPDGRTWGSTSGVDVDKDGRTIWVAERCSTNSCWNAERGEMSALDPLLKFDTSGRLIAGFGRGTMVFPHGIHVDGDGNIWVTDGRDNLPVRRPDDPAQAPQPKPPATVIGHQVHKFTPDGKLVMSLGKAGGNQPGQPVDPASFFQPNDVITYQNGDILVGEGHGGANARLIRFDKTGRFVREFGRKGDGPEGEFGQTHGLAFDSKGRLFVADRSNNRLLILDPETYKTLDIWYQFSRLSGIFIDRNDMLYGVDSESGSVNPGHKAWLRGMRIGSVRDGKVLYFIPDPSHGDPAARGTLAAEGVAVDAAGNIYGAEVGPRKVQKYVKK